MDDYSYTKVRNLNTSLSWKVDLHIHSTPVPYIFAGSPDIDPCFSIQSACFNHSAGSRKVGIHLST